MEVKVLDKGLVKLVGFTVDLDDLAPTGFDDHLPTYSYRLDLDKGLDAQVVRAARASYTGGTKTKREDAALIDYLIRHGHWSPFEMVQVKFFVKAPLFVVQQLLRHRTFSFNQESARYSVIEDEYYMPEAFRKQDTRNKQGSLPDTPMDSEGLLARYQRTVEASLLAYRQLLQMGVAREMARMVLPVSVYTKLYVRGDLRNWLHFLELRLDDHAQWEIRQYAEAIYHILKFLAPTTLKSWEEHVLHSMTFSRKELRFLQDVLRASQDRQETLLQQHTGFTEDPLTESQARELKDKLNRLLL